MSLSDVSSLTDLSSDEEYAPSKTVSTKQSRERQSESRFKLKDILTPPRQSTYSTKTLYEQIVEGNIDLNPEYQREVVWPDSKQSNLIDSLLRNFSIPPVIFALHISEDGTEKRTCIDGKQRLTSIHKFMDGIIPHKDSRSSVKRFYKSTSSNKSAKLLPLPYRQSFAHKQIVCIEYMGISDDSEREIFQRVQLGVALTPAERMQAISTPWTQLIRDCIKLFDIEVGTKLKWSDSRGRDFQCLASVIFLVDKNLTSFTATSTLEKWMQRTTAPPKAFGEKVQDAISVLGVLLEEEKFEKTFVEPKISPVELIMVLFLIHEYMNTSSLQQLNNGISKMRKEVRAKFDDIRNNGKCNKQMFSFIKERFPANLKKAPSGELAASVAAKKAIASRQGKNVKRKRERDESSDDDDVPLRTTSKSPSKKTPKGSSTAPPKTSARENTTSSTSSRQTPTRAAAATTQPSSSKVKVDPSPPPSTADAHPGDRLAKLRAAAAASNSSRRNSASSAPASSSVETVKVPIPSPRVSTDMGPPPSTGGSASRSHTPMSVSPATAASLPMPLNGMTNFQNDPHAFAKAQQMLQQLATPTSEVSSFSATQWPNQSPPQSAPPGGIPIPLSGLTSSMPVPPASAPVHTATRDPRVRSGSGAQAPRQPSYDYDRRDSMDIDSRHPRFEDERMDRSRYDDRGYGGKYAQPPPASSGAYHTVPRSPTGRYSNGASRGSVHRNSYSSTNGPAQWQQRGGGNYNASSRR